MYKRPGLLFSRFFGPRVRPPARRTFCPTSREKSSPWIVDPRVIEQQDIGQRLARAVGRDVALRWRADSLAVRSLPHRFNTDIKVHPKTGRAVSVAGTVLPFVMEGTEDALRLAWYAGLGSKTRMGFGCWDVQPQGMGEGEGA